MAGAVYERRLSVWIDCMVGRSADLVGGPAMTRMRVHSQGFENEGGIGPQRGMVIRIDANLGVMWRVYRVDMPRS